VAAWKPHDDAIRDSIASGRARISSVLVPAEVLEKAAKLCMALGTDGLRGELTVLRAARAVAALDGAAVVTDAHVKRIAPMALSHRLRRNPLDEAGSRVRVERALGEVLGAPHVSGPTLVAAGAERRAV
jgi:magnesium chelatase subunit I